MIKTRGPYFPLSVYTCDGGILSDIGKSVTKSNVFKYHKGCKHLNLTHLSFADDILVFCHGDGKSVKVIKEALLEFSKSSGLVPNMDKSVIFFGSVKEDIKKDILQALPFKVGKIPVKYLGIPLMAKRLGIKECKCLVDKVKSMQAYLAAVVKIPKTIINDIDRVLKSSYVPNDWKDIVAKIAELPCNNAIRSVVRRIILATAVYYIWKERNLRIFASSNMASDNLLQVIMENIRLQIQNLHVKKSTHVCKIANEWNMKFSNEEKDCLPC
ncbi:RNA-directed DNA polymerase, eukaryota, reverse transcriptase zinc-binding domain protein [Tanacetum coccineum]